MFGAQSEKAWSLILDALRAVTPADAFSKTEKRISSFAAGSGTVLFYEDELALRDLQSKYPAFSDAFPRFICNSAGMAQLSVWTALAEEGVGASLQHYNGLADQALAAAFNVPASWTLVAQMPFGSNEGSFGEKSTIADADRFITVGL
ncbi:hypothetical protein GCM10011315_43180 [Roseovarius pacificus]|nr:hypothetical protein GCM10011315_43180 [Roseovarius pacificus]